VERSLNKKSIEFMEWLQQNSISNVTKRLQLMAREGAGLTFFSDLEARGFGPVTGPGWSSGKNSLTIEPEGAFSYFTYKVYVQDARLDTWAKMPTDLIWAFCRHDAYEQAGPCLLRLYERPVPSGGETCQALARHWCPILFEEDLVNK
jgi:hypothetical protein